TDGSHFFSATEIRKAAIALKSNGKGARGAMPTLDNFSDGENAVVGKGINQVAMRCTARRHRIHWQLVPVPRLAGYFQIKNRFTGWCIDADGEDLKPGGKIHMVECRQVDNQFWIPESVR
ncbi:MAG: RICIN domain-containing protein, partial [Bryobacteraceae bacterium]